MEINNPQNIPPVYILMAEDDQEDQFIMTDAFREEGLDKHIRFVENGEMVLEELAASASKPSLIVLDLNMPILNGTQTLRLLKEAESHRDIPVIIYSTSLNLIEMEECMHLGAESYTIKPNTFSECRVIARRFYQFCCKQYSFPKIDELFKQVS